MITDLQGKGFVLSDPAVHTLDPSIIKEVTNLGIKGFNKFF
jgi:hypothetical protein